VAAVVLALLTAGLGLTEAAGVTKIRATVVRIFTPDGTLVVEADDPDVKITIEGDGGLVITGAGAQEVRVRPGSYKVQAVKDGKPAALDRDVVTISKGDKQIVRVRVEGNPVATVTRGVVTGSFTASVKPPGATEPIVRTYTLEERLASGGAASGTEHNKKDYPWGTLWVEWTLGPNDVLMRDRLRIFVKEDWGDVSGEVLHITTSRTDGQLWRRDLKGVTLSTAGGPIPLYFDESPGLDRAEITLTGAIRVQSLAKTKPETKSEPGAFVLLGSKGVAERKFDTLAEAVVASNDGDTIEVRGNGPFVSQTVAIQDRALVIRAAGGFRPVIKPEPSATACFFLTRNVHLVLEGLDLQWLWAPYSQCWVVGEGADSRLRLANCRLLMHRQDPGHVVPVVAWGGPHYELRNCELLVHGAGGSLALDCAPSPGGAVTVANCLVVGEGTAVTLSGSKSTKLLLTHNTMLGTRSLRVILRENIDGPAGGGPKPLEAEGSGNLFRAPVSFNQWHTSLAPGKTLNSADAELALRRVVAWHESGNLYALPDGRDLLQLAGDYRDMPPNLPTQTIPQWKEFWASDAPASFRGTAKFEGGDLIAKLAATPEQVSSEDFRLLSNSAGYRAGKDGKDLGADIDLVGPGLAYERWKKTPDYQQWLKDIGQVKK
jgi:hypothetical protein